MTLKSSSHLRPKDIVQLLKLHRTIYTHPHEEILFGLQPPHPAAVLVPLIRMPDQKGEKTWHILYTRRTDQVQDHKGQVSFPGGRSDPEDGSPEETALREAYEEIGLYRHDVRILGLMDRFMTITNYLVTPVVGVIPWPYPFHLQPEEVVRVFIIPMDWMSDPQHFEIRQRELPDDFPVPPQFRRLRVIYFNEYDGEILWGATAEVTLRLLNILGLMKTTGTDQKEAK